LASSALASWLIAADAKPNWLERPFIENLISKLRPLISQSDYSAVVADFGCIAALWPGVRPNLA
jgi:hypothetical protein